MCDFDNPDADTWELDDGDFCVVPESDVNIVPESDRRSDNPLSHNSIASSACVSSTIAPRIQNSGAFCGNLRTGITPPRISYVQDNNNYSVPSFHGKSKSSRTKKFSSGVSSGSSPFSSKMWGSLNKDQAVNALKFHYKKQGLEWDSGRTHTIGRLNLLKGVNLPRPLVQDSDSIP